jgi:hypothetical protein
MKCPNCQVENAETLSTKNAHSVITLSKRRRFMKEVQYGQSNKRSGNAASRASTIIG